MKSLLRFHRAASLLPLIVVFAGCLSDPIDRPEVKPRVVTAPPRAWFFATNFQAPLTGDMVVRWNHAASDTQQNFKGYHVRLYTSTFDSTISISIPHDFVAETTVLKVGSKVDTSAVFTNVPIGHYTAYVHGLKFADTLALSTDSIAASGEFDPRPLLNPTAIRATSINRQEVKIEWDVPSTDTMSALLGYQVYYMDADTGKFALRGPLVGHRPGQLKLSADVGGLPDLRISENETQPERAFRFWVKSVRTDNIEFSADSATIVWAGAARVPVAQDSAGFRHSLFFGLYPQGLSVIDDSVDQLGYVQISVHGSDVTLTPGNGAQLIARIDTSLTLDSVLYDHPVLPDATIGSYTLSSASPGIGGVIVYITIPNIKGTQYARIWIKQQPDGSFVTQRGGIIIQASYQTGHTLSGAPYVYY